MKHRDIVWRAFSTVGVVGLAALGVVTIPQSHVTDVTEADQRTFDVTVDTDEMSLVCPPDFVDPSKASAGSKETRIIGANNPTEISGGATLVPLFGQPRDATPISVAVADQGISVEECVLPGQLLAVVGGSTEAEEDSVLTVVNPATQPVEIEIEGFGESGYLGSPDASLTIPAESARSWLVAAWFPDQPTIGLSIKSRGVGVAAWLQSSGWDGEVSQGLARMRATQPGTTEVFPQISERDHKAVLHVMNPEDSKTTIAVNVDDGTGLSPLPGAESIPIPPGAVTSVSLKGLSDESVVVEASKPVSASISFGIQGNTDKVVREQKTWSRTLIAPAFGSVFEINDHLAAELKSAGLEKVDTGQASVDVNDTEYMSLNIRGVTSSGPVEVVVGGGGTLVEKLMQRVTIAD